MFTGILEFKGTWRKYQARVLERAGQYLNDGKIHIVYVGVIEHEGTDAYLAINVAKYLSSKYNKCGRTSAVL